MVSCFCIYFLECGLSAMGLLAVVAPTDCCIEHASQAQSLGLSGVGSHVGK